MAVFVTCVILRGQPADEPLPTLVGVLKSKATGVLFSVRWTDTNGATLQSWRRIGDRAGGFELVSFDEAADVLSIKYSNGRIYRIVLPDGKVTPGITKQEFDALRSFLPGEKNAGREAPVLTREKARAFWLRFLEELAVPPDLDLVLDFAGSSLPAAQQAEFLKARAKARRDGYLFVLEVRNDGAQHGNTVPINAFGIPEPMTRNLMESDWEELSSLTAGLMIRAMTLNAKGIVPR